LFIFQRYSSTEIPKPIDKKVYKGTNPTCHDFNLMTACPDGTPLLVGFSTGQILLVDPFKKDFSKAFNEEVCKFLISNSAFKAEIKWNKKHCQQTRE